MKKTAVLIILLLSVIMSGCAVSLPTIETTRQYDYEYRTTAPVPESDTYESISSDEYMYETTEPSQVTVMQQETTLATQEVTTEEVTTSEEKTTKEETTKKEENTVKEETTSVQTVTEVDLSISMPAKNGTIETDLSPENKFIKIVCDKKGIDAKLLAAVYSVPDSGQNYVFEFYDSDTFTADNLRRVYLIDSQGNITGIAAADSSEKENISTVENWFSMNVLIKELIFPAVADELK